MNQTATESGGATAAAEAGDNGFIDQALAFISDPANLLGFGKKLLIFIVALWVGIRVIRFIQKLVRKGAAKSNLDEGLQKFLASLVGWFLKAALFVAIAEIIGIPTTSFVAILGAAGLAIGLALQGTLANFAGGVLIMVFKPYKIGDLVESQGVLGEVVDIQIFTTILTTPENKMAIMPNGAVMNNHIINYTEQGQIRVDTVIGIAYNEDIQAARNAIMEALTKHPKVLKDPAPAVTVLELGDSAVNLAVRPWCDPVDYWDVYFDTLEQGKLALDRAGISIPFPQVDVHMISNNS